MYAHFGQIHGIGSERFRLIQMVVKGGFVADDQVRAHADRRVRARRKYR